ncbi:MAG: Gx transporter family protein [Terrisporobacter othiniensis]|uniref:Gx transporter family protein n=2 Tax=Terrisporobacter TaxID=1505652 RepID=A0AAX2ZLV5_9FIRM|nr:MULTISPECIES: Gx transporter family protein [Terrisporobacter]MBN9647951.1 Gx transporter family protein [Terrisporobacter glycolicus]MDU4862215.1 Gx transporter family protein [Terrisporobacter othiniensis]MDU6995875.1 Gx transporter family protein [Terrisporobacter othiniensis]UEL49302.1 Gx transporter family protein [Terrisporobacter hibernicus]UPA30730.1 Gx transporter family protein [Terrisporobacter glycolicus]
MKTKKMTLLGLMVTYSLVLYIFETYIPNPLIAIFPGAKLGLSNIITLISLIILGVKDTCIILTVRIILSSIFAGPISYFLFSVGGAYLSLICMYLTSKIKGFSIIGVSIIGAIGHNIGQLLVASIIVQNINMVGYLPFMLIASLVTGMFVGLVSKYCCPKIDKIFREIVDK